MAEEGELKLEDTNCAGIGSEEDRALRKSAAKTEEAWTGCGMEPGVNVWRIEKFQVKPWPKEEYGKFFDGDSYIVLRTRKDPESEKLLRDIHFWLGDETSIDEQGTAAYKTVELDDYFDGEPIQHREVQGHESSEFRSLFKEIHYLKGGIESGFNKVGPGVYEARLLQVRKVGSTTCVTQVPVAKDSMNAGDCYILDAGDKIFRYYGDEASPFEKQRCGTAAENLEGSRNGKAKAMDYSDDAATFWGLLGGEGPIKSAAEGRDTALDRKQSILGGTEDSIGEGVLFKLSDDTGKLRFAEVARGNIKESMLESTNAYVLDTVAHLFVWIGAKASTDEASQAVVATIEHIKATERPKQTPITMFKECGKPITHPTWIAVMKD